MWCAHLYRNATRWKRFSSVFSWCSSSTILWHVNALFSHPHIGHTSTTSLEVLLSSSDAKCHFISRKIPIWMTRAHTTSTMNKGPMERWGEGWWNVNARWWDWRRNEVYRKEAENVETHEYESSALCAVLSSSSSSDFDCPLCTMPIRLTQLCACRKTWLLPKPGV